MSGSIIDAVNDFTAIIKRLLARAREVKPNGSIEPILTEHELGQGVQDFAERTQANSNQYLGKKSSSHFYATIETACRNIFYEVVVRPRLRITADQTKVLRHQRQSMSPHSVKSGTCLTSSPYCRIKSYARLACCFG